LFSPQNATGFFISQRRRVRREAIVLSGVLTVFAKKKLKVLFLADGNK